ncbi:hypothetical protein KPH14_002283 [Odynerus spinipes]|uniref:Uncharacterized protein n=1 Tax=Odynerus spinipes TaxID=1348599 RepID=A0AAD9RL95_9HYME|nr:hypothetical protein KPH14_002283 [Odynerus spinipes]
MVDAPPRLERNAGSSRSNVGREAVVAKATPSERRTWRMPIRESKPRRHNVSGEPAAGFLSAFGEQFADGRVSSLSSKLELENALYDLFLVALLEESFERRKREENRSD